MVVVDNQTTGYTRPVLGWWMVIDEKGAYASTASEATRVYERGLNGVAKTGTHSGIGVLMLQNNPERPMRDPSILNQIFLPEELTSCDSSNDLTNRTGTAEVKVSAANRGNIYLDSWHLTARFRSRSQSSLRSSMQLGQGSRTCRSPRKTHESLQERNRWVGLQHLSTSSQEVA